MCSPMANFGKPPRQTGGRYHVLTAAHVWEKILKKAPFIGFTLKERRREQPYHNRRLMKDLP
jgi:hypothetical protein